VILSILEQCPTLYCPKIVNKTKLLMAVNAQPLSLFSFLYIAESSGVYIEAPY
jgi:hypothetical protein